MECKQDGECKEVRFGFITIPNVSTYLYHDDAMILFSSIIVKPIVVGLVANYVR